MAYAESNFIVDDDGRRWGPFSSHWAACAALIRRSNPTFRSLGGDRDEDLAIEAGRQALRSLDETPSPNTEDTSHDRD